jgi:[acyl-carrier-protein] S-malonyltransferase
MTKIAFLFPGQGAQAPGMGKELYDASPAARAIYDRADAALDFKISSVCFEGPQEKLNLTDMSQPAILATSIASLEAMREKGGFDEAAVAACAGLSLGEYSALVFAGALAFEDAVRLVRKRGTYMQEACDARPGGMLSLLGADLAAANALCEKARSAGEIGIANLNNPGQIVVSGENAAVDAAEKSAREFGIKRAVRLKVAGAFHSALMAPAGGKLANAIKDVKISAPRVAVVSNVTARPHGEPETIRRLLVRQVSESVQWEESVRWMIAQGVERFYVFAPSKELAGLMARIDPAKEVVAL